MLNDDITFNYNLFEMRINIIWQNAYNIFLNTIKYYIL